MNIVEVTDTRVSCRRLVGPRIGLGVGGLVIAAKRKKTSVKASSSL